MTNTAPSMLPHTVIMRVLRAAALSLCSIFCITLSVKFSGSLIFSIVILLLFFQILVFLQYSCQPVAAAEQPYLDIGQGHARNLRQLGQAAALLVERCYQKPVLRLQLGHCLLQGSVLPLPQLLELYILSAFEPRRTLLQFLVRESLPAYRQPFLPHGRDSQVVGYAVEPGGDGALAPVFAQGEIRLDKRLLRHVLRVLPAARHPVEHCENHAAVSVHNLPEEVLVPVQYLVYECALLGSGHSVPYSLCL